MQQGDLFEYLAAFVTIVLAVAITDMIQSTHRLIRGRRRVTWHVLPLMFAAMIAMGVISEFFALWDTFAVSKVTFPQLMWMLTVPTLYALLAYSVLPDEVPPEGLDLWAFYLAERRTWVILLALGIVLDVVRSTLLLAPNPDWVREYALFIAPLLPPTVAGLIMIWASRSRRWNWAGVLLVAGPTIYGTSNWVIPANA